jgi:hypothetical protein
MVEADHAEARGDAESALSILSALPLGPDGKPFWRPWRIQRLLQFVAFGHVLPRWATSRWILAQAMQSLDPARRGPVHQAMHLAVELRGGQQALPGIDEVEAWARLIDHDWVFRQSLLYDLGGLEHFLRRQATPDLVAGADQIDKWTRASVGGFRLIGHEPGWVTWEDLAADERVRVPNIGSAALVVPGEWVIGRLVPTEEGRMFESTPLRVPERAASMVASDPLGWIDALRTVRDEDGSGEVVTGPRQVGLLSDVPPPVWQHGVLACGRRQPMMPTPANLAAATLRVARQELDAPRDVEPDDLDIWACVSAALLDPTVVGAMAAALTPADVEVLQSLSNVLAEPAAGVCRYAATGDPLAA